MQHSVKSGKTNRRIDEIDIVRALAIMLMVACHSGVVFAKFIYLFHMAVFFIASGFFFRDASSDNLKSVWEFIRNKIRKLWFPFFLWNTVFVLLHNPLEKTVILPETAADQAMAYTPVLYSGADILSMIGKGVLFSYKEPLIGGFWFLKILFLVSITWCLIDFLLKHLCKKMTKGQLETKRIHQSRMILQAIISVALLLFGYSCSTRGIQLYGLAYVGSYYCLYFMGHLLSGVKVYFMKWSWPVLLLILIASFGILFYLNPLGVIGYNLNEYSSPQYMVCCAFSGWCFLYSMAWFLKKIPGMNKMMITIGKHTLSVLIFHLPVLKLVQIVEADISKIPIYGLSGFPVLQAGKSWWCLLYVIIGTGIPVLLEMMACRVRRV